MGCFRKSAATMIGVLLLLASQGGLARANSCMQCSSRFEFLFHVRYIPTAVHCYGVIVVQMTLLHACMYANQMHDRWLTKHRTDHCPAGVVSGDPPSSSSAVKHETSSHVRKLLVSTTDPRGAAVNAAAETMMMSPDDCSEEVVEVSQDNGGPLPNGIPSYSVTITNTCLGCTVRDVHVSCGEFASTELVDPSDFRRVAYGDCLVRDGGPMGPGETILFEYSNSFLYPMDVASVSCGNI
ncbi:TPD1 protein homolog 1B-like [Phragmites australis]|uniref:TPD1 protein homolog 1B-like n=1 Tax=Phragmites australis TaxID=29695 RepID=UPI002D794178|nr:TPD1 protein homolog 1B-like [Phragmites australis]